MSYLFLVTIGPVQDFIAAARRSRDLWFGSWLLSALSKAAARAIEQHGGEVTLIFPAPEQHNTLDRDNESNVANKILAQVTTDPDKLGQKVSDAVEQELLDIAGTAFKETWPSDVNEHARQQMIELIEFYWSSVQVGSDYALARRQVEATMAARKATRDFLQPRYSDMVPKSSLDGQRESVIPENMYPGRNLDVVQRQKMANTLRSTYGAGVAERLSGVDLLKRLGKTGGQTFFPSTSDVAIRPALAALEHDDREARKVWHDYVRMLHDDLDAYVDDERVAREHPILGGFDGGLLYTSRLGELFTDRGQRRKAEQALRKVYRQFGISGEPLPYYALLLADGDRMGATIDQQKTQEQHRALSQRLARFAGKVRKIIQDHNGNLVYTGGDDVLAFVPLHTLLRCAAALHDEFAKIINPPSAIQFHDAEDRSPTLSVGVAVCHHIEPMSDALALARSAEKQAKGVSGKDALAIILSKRGGADITVRDHWGELDQRLQNFVALHRLEAVPDGAAFELRDLTERLRTQGADQQQTQTANRAMGDLARAEAERILKRKQPQRGKAQELAQQTLTTILDTLQPDLSSIRAVAEELIVARIFAQAEDDAGLLKPDAIVEDEEQ